MTHRLNRPVLFVLLCSALASCKTEMGASYAELLRVIEPDSSCVFAPTNNYSSAGFYDPVVNDGTGYKLTWVIKNNLAKAADDSVALGELTNVHGVVNDVRVEGFEGCWYRTADANITAAQDGNGIIDCDAIPAQSGYITAPQTTLEGGDTSAVSVMILRLEDMRSLFGSNFEPKLLPLEGPVAALNEYSNDPNLQYNYSLDTASPADIKTRSPYWGQAFPTQRDVEIRVQLRAKMSTQSGTSFHTNYLSYPITIYPGGLQNSCGMLIPKVCARGPCGSGAACTVSGSCADGTQCSNAVLLSGTAPQFDFAGTCLPAQGYYESSKTCTQVGCNAAQ